MEKVFLWFAETLEDREEHDLVFRMSFFIRRSSAESVFGLMGCFAEFQEINTFAEDNTTQTRQEPKLRLH